MLTYMMTMVERFQREILGYPIPEKPTALPMKRAKARHKHLVEEADELLESKTLAGQADALIDSIYVALGGLIEMGVLPGPLFEEVQRANMAKKRGSVATRPGHEGYDAVKPEGWTPPNFEAYLSITKDDVEKMHRQKCFDDAVGRRLVMPAGAVSVPSVFSARPYVRDENGGLKDDKGKMRFSLLLEGMPHGLRAVVEILEFGAKKYAAHNWKKVENAVERYREAFYRHATAPKGILGRDPESGLTHAAHAACDLLFLLQLTEHQPDYSSHVEAEE